MKIKNPIKLFLFHPIFLVFVGTILGLYPYIFGSKYLVYYPLYYPTFNLVFVYILGLVAFSFGFFIAKYATSKNYNSNLRIKKGIVKLSIVAYIFTTLGFLKLTSYYGGIPVVRIVMDGFNIARVNEVERMIGGGVFGLYFISVYIMIIIFPYLYLYNQEEKSKKWLLVYFSTIILFCGFSGKRQMLFVFFMYSTSFIALYYKLNSKVKLYNFNKKIFFFGMLLITMFVTVGYFRNYYVQEKFAPLDPVLHYLTQPYVNLSAIIQNVNLNTNAFTIDAFGELLIEGMPSLVTSWFGISGNHTNIPVLEPTSPSTIYAEVFWGFHYVGVFVFLFLIGIFVCYIYKKACSNNNIYISLYSLVAWPLISIHTYNHFLNFMFLIIPVSIIVVSRIIYMILPKTRLKY